MPEDQPLIAKIPRKKVRISRSRLLDTAVKVMNLCGSNPAILEVEFFEEVGTGLGPTLEFFADASKEFCKTQIWRETVKNVGGQLFPSPIDYKKKREDKDMKYKLSLFHAFGQFCARALIDSRVHF